MRAAVLVSLAAGASAWSCNGHMTVAQIALDSGIMSANTIAAVNELVSLLAPTYPATGATFQEIACWADDIRSKEPATAGWHFVDFPVCRLAVKADCTQPSENNNVVWAIDTAEAELEASATAQQEKARQVRFLVHFVGDLHQPLHASTYFSSQFPPPSGDRGGNSWRIAGAAPATELHALWDEGLGQWASQFRRPMNASGFAWVAALSSKVRNLYPASSLGPEIAETNVTAWAVESHAFAESFVYTAPQAPAKISAEYIATGQGIVLKQLAIAGYRLASALEFIHTSPADAVWQRVLAPASE